MIRILPCRAACSSVQDFNNFKISVPLWRAFVRLVLSLIPSLHVAGEDRGEPCFDRSYGEKQGYRVNMNMDREPGYIVVPVVSVNAWLLLYDLVGLKVWRRRFSVGNELVTRSCL